jgi:hypothetical protein
LFLSSALYEPKALGACSNRVQRHSLLTPPPFRKNPVARAASWEQMGKKKIKKQSAKATLAEVTKEMAKPRVDAFAREHNHIVRNDGLVVKHDIQK